MVTPEELKQKFQKWHENFDFKDLIGFSSLVFGLLLSNSAVTNSKTPDSLAPETTVVSEKEKSKDQLQEKKTPTKITKKKKRYRQSKVSKKPKTLKNTKKQTITASNKN